MHAFSTCSVDCTTTNTAFSLCFIARPQYLFVCLFFFASFSLKSKPFRRALNSNSLPCPAIFPFFNLTSWRHLHDFHGSFLKFFFVFSLFGFCLSFDFCWFFGALQSGNCILPLSIRLALGHLAINFGKLNKKLISKKLKYLSAVIDGKRLASIYYWQLKLIEILPISLNLVSVSKFTHLFIIWFICWHTKKKVGLCKLIWPWYYLAPLFGA